MAARPKRVDADTLASASPALLRAVRHLLRPLVKLLLRNGVPFPALSALLKEIYFEVASQDLAPDEKKQTNSQISLITGIHRKDVRRLLTDGTELEALHKTTSLAAEIVTRWISDPTFLNNRKQPAALARLASVGAERSFEFLASSISKDVRPRSLLDELLRLEMVTLDSNDRVILNQQAFVPKAGSEAMAFFFGQNAHDHLAAAAHNLLSKDPMFLEQGIFGDQLSATSVDKIAALVRDEWRKMVRKVVPHASRLDAHDAKSGKIDMRMRFGIYFYADKSQPAASKSTKINKKITVGKTRSIAKRVRRNSDAK